MENDTVKVRAVNLTKKFGDLLVLDHISFDVKKGEFVCIVGPTGCGKTTFLNILSNIWPATEGTLLIDGEKADPQKHNIAFAFQESSAFPWLTVEQNIRFGMEQRGFSKETIHERTEQMMELLDLKEVRNQYPKQSSASMESRVVIEEASP
jgi:sulfonate transport system ATP-binding protein